MSADGLQATRTTLSWRRTVASAAACGGLLVHQALTTASGRDAAALLLAGGLGPLALGVASAHRARRQQASPRLVGGTAVAVALVSLLALLAT
ncbi:DUF202 domain-containing protein [Pimelobacter simplex]|uniref:DUF202 domain-containing protein n=1 Tax=Nocardioides simplex TaxID=2045 RepID=UPI003AAB95D4